MLWLLTLLGAALWDGGPVSIDIFGVSFTHGEGRSSVQVGTPAVLLLVIVPALAVARRRWSGRAR